MSDSALYLDKIGRLFTGERHGDVVVEQRCDNSTVFHVLDALEEVEPGTTLLFTFELEFFACQRVTVRPGEMPGELEERAYEMRFGEDVLFHVDDGNIVDVAAEQVDQP